MNNRWTLCGGIFALLAVALGAFGAHALAVRVTPQSLEVYKTGVFYQMFHALALLVIGGRSEGRANNGLLDWSGGLLCGGIVLFSGSLYVLAVLPPGPWGILTPVGGLCFLVAWLVFIASVLTEKRDAPHRS